MKLIFGDETFEIDRQAQSLEQIWNEVEAEINQSGRYIQLIEADGVEVHADFLPFLLEQTGLQIVQVHASTLEQMYIDLTVSVRQYIEQAIPQIQNIANSFYKQMDGEAWNMFAQFAEGMEWIDSAIISLIGYESSETLKQQLVDAQHKFNVILTELSSALEKQDLVLIGDLIAYEIVPILESTKAAVTQLRSEIEGSYVS